MLTVSLPRLNGSFVPPPEDVTSVASARLGRSLVVKVVLHFVQWRLRQVFGSFLLGRELVTFVDG